MNVYCDRIRYRKAVMNAIIALGGNPQKGEAALRSESTYTISEALDLLDETLNYAYCRPGTPLQETTILSDTLIMEVTIYNAVTEGTIASLFDVASDNIGTQYHALSLTNKQPWVFSVTPYGSVENGELPIIVQLEVAHGGYITEEIEFGSTDDYSFRFEGGPCGGVSKPGAPPMLRDNLKFLYVVNNPSTKKYYFKPYYFIVCNQLQSTTYCEADGIPNDLCSINQSELNEAIAIPQYRNNINDWKLFRQHEGIQANYDECLSGGTEIPHCQTNMGGYIANNAPQNYVPGNVWVGSRKVFQSGDGVPFHNMLIGYYKQSVVSSEDNPIELPDPQGN